MNEAMITTPTSWADWILILPVVLPLMGAALMLALRAIRGTQAPVAFLVTLAVLVFDIALFLRVLETGPIAMTMGRWLPPFGISFTADLLGAGLAAISALVTLVILVVLGAEPRRHAGRDSLYPLVLMLLCGVSGAFLTGDLFNLYVWFEVMLIASFGLMAITGTPLVLDGTIKYGFINFLATSLFLAALGLAYGLLGTLNMADMAILAGDANPAAMGVIAALLLLAFGIKAAAFPVNAWLPASYHTPPAVISALMGALLTKVGVYALLRTLITMFPDARALLDPVIVTAAIATLLLSPLGAIAETNLRRAIGFLVMGGIGACLAGLALPSVDGLAGTSFYLGHAMVTMTALYLLAGFVEKVTGETDSRAMGGVYGAQSWLSILFFVVMLAAAGVPPFLGFWPKLMLVEAGFDLSGFFDGAPGYEAVPLLLVGAIILNAWLTLIAGTRLWAHIFLRPGREGALSEQPNDRLVRLGRREALIGLGSTGLLVGGIVIAGLLPDFAIGAARIAATDLLDPARYLAAVGLGGGQ
ncbi:Na+/H+ antiporter subunit D [Arsenicitalea aurantiaca]|uniref:Na+/H+ antiporter subunit D n=1 Tax=Arsenicitalea aurantiaca TaxID=1783274 RepID=A0A433XAE6_9HYPH|nr:proton-conducting transporter membrane subunit [Arsenicitalea aurantiaca]RUT31032.1 Na+/H+ antiporter subunit D [Arsenicitalea aurantiaca]